MSLSDSEDELVAYGTPVEPLEEDEVPSKKPRLLEDQIVTDKQGRRRFHGAFTGGFSAGFFNTVGSLEGWTPSSFKSSKSKKQEALQQKPEDFMDDEDMSEFGIAPVVLKARRDYTIESKRGKPDFPELLTLGTYVLQDVLKHVRETIGIKLLKKMGWKPGQGVGPRLTKNEKINSLKMRQKTYGCQLRPRTLEQKERDSNSDSEWDDIQFAPSDYEPFFCETRNNFCGLGYEGLDKRPVLSGNSIMSGGENVHKKSKKPVFGSQAFGVGAFEEEDEDIYAKDDMSNYNFYLGKDESTEGNKQTKKSVFSSDDVLEGFALETKTRPIKSYPLPTIPKGLKPQHKVRRSRFDQPPENNRGKAIKGAEDSHEQRRKLLEASEEIMEAKKRDEMRTKKLIANVKATGNEFKPFSANPEKQERYENYLKLSNIGKKELLSDLQPLSMTDWDKEREEVEFEKAALLFRPLSGGMEDRFATASQPDDLSDPLAVVEKYVDENDDRKKAAKMKMFGQMTRTAEQWIPDPLLCKRFNIPQPGTSNAQSSQKRKTKSSFNLFDYMPNPKENIEVKKPVDTSPEKLNEDEPEPVETKDENITDLYKAIFLASDDEEKDSEEVNEVETHNEQQNSNKTSGRKETSENLDTLYEERVINSKRNLSPPKGIFQNIDLELLSGRKKLGNSATEDSNKNKVVESIDSAERSNLPSNLVYGPQMPEKVPVSKKASTFTSEPFTDCGVWVEKKRHGEKKHKKKDKKSKKASHKSKHKHKHKR